MIPYLLAVAGGYLLGDSMKYSTPQFADGGKAGSEPKSFKDAGEKIATIWKNNPDKIVYNYYKKDVYPGYGVLYATEVGDTEGNSFGEIGSFKTKQEAINWLKKEAKEEGYFDNITWG